jgi:hypothetical protein
MESPPVNRLLQLLRQRPSDDSPAAPAAQTSAAPSSQTAPPPPREHPQHALKSDTQLAPSKEKSSIQGATSRPKSDIQPATRRTKSDTQSDTFQRKRNTQPATKSDTQPATSSIQSAPSRSKRNTQPATSSIRDTAKSDIPDLKKSSILYATTKNTSRRTLGLSKGQQRVLRYLMANRLPHEPTRTAPVGYDAISRHCFLSRSGSRKVIGELCSKGLIRRLETQRGETQGSVYHLESDTQYAPYLGKSSTPDVDKSSTPDVDKSDTPHICSSSKDLLLQVQDLLLEDAFQDLNPKSLVPHLDKFDAVEDFQDFLDMANACIAAAHNGRGKPIKNPHGFLFAQLRQGYINPPEGYKSRRVRAQEHRNQQLEAELEELRQLKARERELRFELFRARLTPEDEVRLDQEAHAQVKPGLGISKERQLEVARENLLRAWFAQQDTS